MGAQIPQGKGHLAEGGIRRIVKYGEYLVCIRSCRYCCIH